MRRHIRYTFMCKYQYTYMYIYYVYICLYILTRLWSGSTPLRFNPILIWQEGSTLMNQTIKYDLLFLKCLHIIYIQINEKSKLRRTITSSSFFSLSLFVWRSCTINKQNISIRPEYFENLSKKKKKKNCNASNHILHSSLPKCRLKVKDVIDQSLPLSHSIDLAIHLSRHDQEGLIDRS